MKNVSGQEYQTPRQAADALAISPQTLRAYSALIEKTTGRPDYFQRDQNNGRLYSAQNIKDLAQVNQIKKEHNKTLKDAISQVFEQQIIKSAANKKETAAKLPKQTAAKSVPQSSNDSLAPILYTLKQLTKQNSEMMTQLQEFKTQLNHTDDKYDQLLSAINQRNEAASSTVASATAVSQKNQAAAAAASAAAPKSQATGSNANSQATTAKSAAATKTSHAATNHAAANTNMTAKIKDPAQAAKSTLNVTKKSKKSIWQRLFGR